MERYSVLMSVYIKERPEYLDQSLESMVKQTVMPDEIVVVEDGVLNEGLYKIIEKYKELYPDIIKTVRSPLNQGLGQALNQGLKVVRNEFVARMDSDDISVANRCEMQLRAFRHMPELSLVGTQIDEFIELPTNIVSSRIVPSSYKDIIHFSRRRSPFNHPTVMFRKSAIIQAGGYKAYGRKEDLDLFIRMIHAGHKAINLKKSYLYYRTDINNLKRRKNWTNCKEYIQIMYGFHKKGWNSTVDMTYIIVGQLIMCFAPSWIVHKLSIRFLRRV